MREAMLYFTDANKVVTCKLCRRYCKIPLNLTGFCGVRKNIDGKLYSLNYGKAIALALDPIEKKPFYHFIPGSLTFSFATVSCNFRCLGCQNWDISQYIRENKSEEIPGENLPPEKIVSLALENGAHGIAYTYTEPTIFMEYALDTAELAREKKLFNVFVTNGYMSREAINEMKGKIDAARIDLKSFNEKTYSEICGNVNLEGILDSIKLLHKIMHIEIIVLVINGINDSDDELRALCKWVAELDKNVPLHFIAFYPHYKMENHRKTDLSTLLRARKIGYEEGLNYVYTGNIPHSESSSTYCPKCKSLLIQRSGFSITLFNLNNDATCKKCGAKQNIILDINEYWKKYKFKD